MKPPRNRIVTFRVRPSIERRIREAARDDSRSVSAFLSHLIERTLLEEAERADG